MDLVSLVLLLLTQVSLQYDINGDGSAKELVQVMVKSSNGSDFLMFNIDGSSYAGNNLLILTLNDVRIPGAQGSV